MKTDQSCLTLKIITIVGARPQFIKAASVSRAIEQHNLVGHSPLIMEIILHTGQHYDYNMSQLFFEQLAISQPKYYLGIGSGTHGEMTGAMLAKIEEVLVNERPDWVIVYGDTNSTLAGALAAAKLHIPVAHVEAGLRSFNRYMPEEINRVLTDHISSLLFCPTDTAVMNLKKEGITEGIFQVGDVMYDAFLFYKDIARKKSTVLSDLQLKEGDYCLGTVHRQENTEDMKRLENIFKAFEKLARPDCPFVIPLHPRTHKALQLQGVSNRFNNHVRILPPVGYLDMVALEAHARVILTDSGGVQKEAYFANVPCVTLRDETEWVETVEAGWNHLAGAEIQMIVEAFNAATNSLPRKQTGLYGGGDTSKILLQKLILSTC